MDNQRASDLTILEKKLIAILAGIPTALGSGNFGHVGVIMETSAYSTMTAGIAFVDPANPGVYPAGLTANSAATIRARAEAEHKELINQFETIEGVCQGVKDLILEAVDNEYLIKIEHETLGFLNQTPRQMLDHLLARGGALDFADTKELLTERDGEWNISKNPQLYFNRVEKATKGLLRNGITSDLNERRNIALFYLKATGELDAAVREWEAKPAADKKWANIKTFISTEYAKENKQNKLTANKSTAIPNKQKSNKWMRRIVRRREHKIIIDSGATSQQRFKLTNRRIIQQRSLSVKQRQTENVPTNKTPV
jgi:hypothetical protein